MQGSTQRVMQGSTQGFTQGVMQGSTEGSVALAGMTECRLCPRACCANRASGDRGVCGADDTLRIARSALHFWEEPIISGQAGSGTIFFSNCPLHCCYCQNAVIANGEAGADVSAARLSMMMLELQSQGAMNINCVSPTQYWPLIADAVAHARNKGLVLPIVWNTSGYETVEAVEALSDTVDVYLTDFKYANPATAQAYSAASDYPAVALAAIHAMVDTVGDCAYDLFCDDATNVVSQRMVKGVVVRHLVLPGHLQDSYNALELLYDQFGNRVRYSIMNQYTPVIDEHCKAAQRYPNLLQRVNDDDYNALLDYADELGIEDYFWQEGPASEESFIPPFDLEGVAGPELDSICSGR